MIMENERIQSEGRLAITQNETRQLEIRAKGLVRSLRGQLDPFCAVEDLNGDQVADLALQLRNILISHREKSELVAAIRKALGR